MVQLAEMGRLVRGQGKVVSSVVLAAGEEAARVRAAAAAALALAQAQGEVIRREAEQRGLEQGRQQAAAEVLELLVAARADADAVRTRTRDMAVELALRMAEKIIGRAVALDAQVMAEIISRTLDESRARSGPVTVRIHPADLAAVEAVRGRWSAGREADVRVVVDEGVGRHGCVVETRTVRVDGRLAAQLEVLARALGPALPRTTP